MTRLTTLTTLASQVDPRLRTFVAFINFEISSKSARNQCPWTTISNQMLEMSFQVIRILCSEYFWIFSLTLSAMSIIHHWWRQNWQHEADVNSTKLVQASSQRPSAANTKRAFQTSGKYHMTMGIRRSDLSRWLEIDDQYLIEHNIRSTLLDHHKPRVLQCRPGSEAACIEVLELVVDFLTRTYPAQFRHQSSLAEGDLVEVVTTGEVFQVSAPFDGLNPLEIAARLAMEDFNVLIKGKDNMHIL